MSQNQRLPTRLELVTTRLVQLLITGVALSALIAVLLWEADAHALRERYEHLKIALFGEWDANGCPPGRTSPECSELQQFKDTLSDIDDATFFKIRHVASLNLAISTGISFNTAQDMIDGRAAKHWCYTNIGVGKVTQTIDLGQQTDQAPPVFHTLSPDSAAQVQALGIDPAQLQQAAKTECWFNKFKLTQQSKQLKETRHD